MATNKPTCAECKKQIKTEYHSIYCRSCQEKVIKANMAKIEMPTSHDIRLIKGKDTMRLKYE